MQRFDSLDSVSLSDTHLAIGSFDGVHLGHRHLLGQMIRIARKDGAQAAAMTFFPHPRLALAPAGETAPVRYLASLEERLDLLADAGLDAVIVQSFDAAFAKTRATDFLQSLRSRMSLRALWAGPRFALGYRREGDISFLDRYGAEAGFRVQVVEPLRRGEEAVSSSRIRSLLGVGDVIAAADLLGRRYVLQGSVVHGDGRGRRIGIPTANLQFWESSMVPARGVYGVHAFVEGRACLGVTNVGVRPTFSGKTGGLASTVETHLLDVDADLYGKALRLEFAIRLREERRFVNAEALTAQIRADIEAARQRLEAPA